MRRGEVFWFGPDPAHGSEQSGRRPAVVVSRDAVNDSSPVIVVVPLTTYKKQRLYPSDVVVRPPDGGLTAESVVLGLQMRAIDKSRLGSRLGKLKESTLTQVENALLEVLDIRR
ncbi:MAG: type II toxin-antitoxin system PemK/MazF family toxin [Candidatus Eremiobacteraeota bacterium]|nr:type II toxin-antitoxin system PemK/MazF family toxin [Candidatus Eremiobacteraeota bacterium]MCW5872400.1 type II toxin-antitoxin system PemK/MazF family toxin [Candidatus Eremiobacteraeota bacterium]